jgi:hypothetical protein
MYVVILRQKFFKYYLMCSVRVVTRSRLLGISAAADVDKVWMRI